MRVTAFGLILFFVCLNISLFIYSQANFFSRKEDLPYELPENIMSKFVSLDASSDNLMIGIVTVSVLGIIGWITGRLLLGGFVALVIFALELAFPILKWVILGFPIFLLQIGVPLFIVTGLNALMAVVWFWFILTLIGTRVVEES